MIRGALIFGSAVCLCATSVFAEKPKVAKARAADDARQTMRIYTECVVQGGAAGARHERLVAFLGQSPTTHGADAVARSLVLPDCLAGASTASTYVSQLRFKASLLRGDLFRALYLKPTTKFGRTILQPSEIASSWSDGEDPSAVLRSFGDCVVALDHAGADLAIRQKPGSAEESDAYRALGPAFGNCVVQGSKIGFSFGVLEGVLAEALYRQAAGVAPAGKTEAKSDAQG